MKLRTLAVCLLFAGVCSAREHDYQKGTLLRMDSSSCGTQEKGSKTVAGEIFGTDGQHKQTQEMLCQEYVLQSRARIHRRLHDPARKDRNPSAIRQQELAFCVTSMFSVAS